MTMTKSSYRWLGLLFAAVLLSPAAAYSSSRDNGCQSSWVGARPGDGRCDEQNNTPECEYDGGDCCSCTCAGETEYDCTDFACVDPEAPCVGDDDITADMFESCGYVMSIGDGYCNIDNNKPECNYDGGDCCECTCVFEHDGFIYPAEAGCLAFACIDPEASCVDDDSITVDVFENCPYVTSIGNGYCDEENNTPECNYDGGDCCECTCVVPDFYVWSDERCGGGFGYGFDCKDPSAPCIDEGPGTSYDFIPWGSDDDQSMSYDLF